MGDLLPFGSRQKGSLSHDGQPAVGTASQAPRHRLPQREGQRGGLRMANDGAGNERGGEGNGDAPVVIDHSTLARLTRILAEAVPHIRLQLEPGSLSRAVLVETPVPTGVRDDQPGDTLGVARQIYHARRRRGRRLAEDLLGEPAWDILLDLFIARKTGRLTPLSTSCIASGVPASTAQRWIRELETRGLIQRQGDPYDARRVYLDLTQAATRQLEQLLTEIGQTRA